MATPAELAQLLRTIASYLEIDARQLPPGSDLAMRLRDQVQRIEDVARQLTGATIRDTLGGSMTPSQVASVKRQSSAKGFVHPLQQAMWAQSPELTADDVAKALGVRTPVVKGWIRAADPRRIPRDLAERAEQLWGIPVAAKSWPNGIRD